MPSIGYKKVEVDIYEKEKICAVYIENNGYCIYINDQEDDMFLIKTDISPEEFKLEENAEYKEDFINIIKLLLDKIYADIDIPEYEEEHQEFVFLKIMDLFAKNNYELIDKDSNLYKTIELGFIKLDINLLNHDSHNK